MLTGIQSETDSKCASLLIAVFGAHALLAVRTFATIEMSY